MKRSKHNLSNYKLVSGNMGDLIPVSCYEVLPGDTVQQHTNALIRANPLMAPVMHPTHVSLQHWFVPTRILWDDFEKFITGGPHGSSPPVHPYFTPPPDTGWAVGSLADYLGIPPGAIGARVSALPFRAYNAIWNSRYRDQDLQTELVNSTASGEDTTSNWNLQKGSWRKDYFTTARPFAAKGPTIGIPVNTFTTTVTRDPVDPEVRWQIGSGINTRNINATGASNDLNLTGPTETGQVTFGNKTGLTLGGPSPTVSPEDIRIGGALLRFEEARARFGSRYTEYLRYLGVKSSDARLQLPEYLGGGNSTIQFSEVLATAESEDTPIGALKGHGIAGARSRRYRRFFEEHGFVITLMCIRPITIYSQGLDRMWLRKTKEDYWQKELETIGSQEVAEAEVYANTGFPTANFGWVDRYADYRQIFSKIAGDFRTVDKDWHFARIFDNPPSLNSTFIPCTPRNDAFATTATDEFKMMVNHRIVARRMVRKSGAMSMIK